MKLKDPSLLQTRCLIDGQWLDADSGKTIAVTNPATGETIAHVPDMGAAETRRPPPPAPAAPPPPPVGGGQPPPGLYRVRLPHRSTGPEC